jgi:DNA-binding CsgD family transcriptional regulator
VTVSDPDALTIAVRVADPLLADRIADLLRQVPGIIVTDSYAPADLALVAPEASYDEQSRSLTPRERDVIALLAEGLSNKAIALRLSISRDTAKFHVGRLIDKLDATGRTDAVAHAARLGIIQL